MCGIIGFKDNLSVSEKKKVGHSMALRLKHRGPDGEGIYADKFVCLAHRRLKIIDLDNGCQPIIIKS